MYSLSLSNAFLDITLLANGAGLRDIRLKGHDHSLILGWADDADYFDDGAHMGAIAGPVANRIAGGQLQNAAGTYELDRNEQGKHTLHGGMAGIGNQLWTLTKISTDMAIASLFQPDGYGGFPGNRHFHVIYALQDSDLHLYISASTDKPSWCNLTPHPYFNLDGTQDFRHHHLQISADYYLPVHEDNIPTGEIADVTGSRFDFRGKTALHDFATGQQPPIDNNFSLLDHQTQTGFRDVATLSSEKSGIEMQIATDQPGLQLYFGQSLPKDKAGLNGQIIAPFAGLCLEPQGWPDAPNHAHFPAIELLPERPYASHSCFRFHG